MTYLLDVARRGEYQVHPAIAEGFDRRMMAEVLRDAVAIDVTNVAEWRGNWKPQPDQKYVNLSLMGEMARPSFAVSWYEYSGITKSDEPFHRAALVDAADEDLWSFELWEYRPEYPLRLTHLWGIDHEHLLITKDCSEDDTWFAANVSVVVMLGQMFMHCKNVTLESHRTIPQKLRRKHERKQGYTPAEYKIINITPIKKIVKAAASGAEPLTDERVGHIVRGNFATYTADRPLFGRVVGKVFRPAHTRGQFEDGVTPPQYRIKL